MKFNELKNLNPLEYLIEVKNWYNHGFSTFPTDKHVLRVMVRKILKNVEDDPDMFFSISYPTWRAMSYVAHLAGDTMSMNTFNEMDIIAHWNVIKVSTVNDLNKQLDYYSRSGDHIVGDISTYYAIEDIRRVQTEISVLPRSQTLDNISSQINQIVNKYENLLARKP